VIRIVVTLFPPTRGKAGKRWGKEEKRKEEVGERRGGGKRRRGKKRWGKEEKRKEEVGERREKKVKSDPHTPCAR